MFSKFLVVAALVVASSLVCVDAFVPQLTNCGVANAMLKNLKVSWTPQNILPGNNVTVTVSGDLTEEVKAATVVATVDFDGIPLIHKSYNLCEKVPKACPVPAGDFKHSIDHKVPAIPLHGKVNLKAVITDTQNGRQVTCVDLSGTI